MKVLLLFVVLMLNGLLCAQYIPYRVGDLWGYSDTTGKLVLEPIYEQTDFFNHGIAFVKKSNFYYTINSKFEVISGPYYTYGYFKNGLCPVKMLNKQCIYIDTFGKQAFELSFFKAENFSEELAIVNNGKHFGIINTHGQWVRIPDLDSMDIAYQSGFILSSVMGKSFYINSKGKFLNLPDSLWPAGPFSEGLAPVYVARKTNRGIETALKFIDTSGKIVINTFFSGQFDYSDYIQYHTGFKDGKAIVKVFNQITFEYHFVNKLGIMSEPYSSAFQVGDSLFVASIGHYMPSVNIINKKDLVLGRFEKQPTQVGVFQNGLIPALGKDGYWGYYNKNGALIIPHQFSNAYNFKNGYAIINKLGKMGVINIFGKEFFRDW